MSADWGAVRWCIFYVQTARQCVSMESVKGGISVVIAHPLHHTENGEQRWINPAAVACAERCKPGDCLGQHFVRNSITTGPNIPQRPQSCSKALHDSPKKKQHTHCEHRAQWAAHGSTTRLTLPAHSPTLDTKNTPFFPSTAAFPY